jgi:hypothetical protein
LDFPPLDDARWDRLLGAVIGRAATGPDRLAPSPTRRTAPAVHDRQTMPEAANAVVRGGDEGHALDLDARA